jgi:hypothetical protein
VKYHAPGETRQNARIIAERGMASVMSTAVPNNFSIMSAFIAD